MKVSYGIYIYIIYQREQFIPPRCSHLSDAKYIFGHKKYLNNSLKEQGQRSDVT